MSTYTMESLRDTLTQSIAAVTFQKINGEVVTRRMTLRSDSIPPVTNARPSADGVLTVMDLDRSGWRSLRVDSIQKVEIAA